MKTNKLTLALAAILTHSALGAMPAALPEFRNEQQLAEWRAEKVTRNSGDSRLSNEAFYTGKPYLASSGGYSFKYRSYLPELGRWTSEDPSGFPDGVNNYFYAAVPTSQLDFQGLWKIRIIGASSDSEGGSSADAVLNVYTQITATGNGAGGDIPARYTSIDLSGYASGSRSRPHSENGDVVMSLIDDPLEATLFVGGEGTFEYVERGGASSTSSKVNGLVTSIAQGMNLRFSDDGKFAFVKMLGGIGTKSSGINGVGINIGPIGASISWDAGRQHSVKTIELQFEIVE